MGLAADVGTLQILPKLVIDHSLFRELVFTSRTFNTEEAKQIGLIRYVSQRAFHRPDKDDEFSSRIFDTRDALLEAAISVASVIARKSPVAVQGSKINLNYARDHTIDDSFTFVVCRASRLRFFSLHPSFLIRSARMEQWHDADGRYLQKCHGRLSAQREK